MCTNLSRHHKICHDHVRVHRAVHITKGVETVRETQENEEETEETTTDTEITMIDRNESEREVEIVMNTDQGTIHGIGAEVENEERKGMYRTGYESTCLLC